MHQRIDIMFSTYGVDFSGAWTCAIAIILFIFRRHSIIKVNCSVCIMFISRIRGSSINIYNLWINTGLDKLIKQNLSRKKNVLSNVCGMISREEALAL